MCTRSDDSIGSTCTRVNRLRKDFGRPLRPPPSCTGFCAAKTRNVGGHRNVSPSSGTNTSARWSSAAFRPSRTGCGARLSSSSNTQSPFLSAAKNAPSAHRNSPAAPPSAGKSAPSRSIMSVCSLRLMRTRLCPAALASADTRLVLPTPGEPSRRMGLGSCIARRRRAALRRVDGAESSNPNAEPRTTGAAPRGMAKGVIPKRPSRSMNSPSPPAVAASPGLDAASIAECACVSRAKIASVDRAGMTGTREGFAGFGFGSRLASRACAGSGPVGSRGPCSSPQAQVVGCCRSCKSVTYQVQRASSPRGSEPGDPT